MTFSRYLPVAIMVGLLAAAFVAVGSKMNLVIWVPFIGWSFFFASGAKYSRLNKEVIGLTGGVFFAVALLFLLPTFSSIFGTAWALPVLVFLIAITIIMLELTNLFELATGYFFGWAGFFAYFFGGFGGANQLSFPLIFNFWTLLMVGLALGMLSHFLREKILDVLKVPPEQRQTVFDKEKKAA